MNRTYNKRVYNFLDVLKTKMAAREVLLFNIVQDGFCGGSRGNHLEAVEE